MITNSKCDQASSHHTNEGKIDESMQPYPVRPCTGAVIADWSKESREIGENSCAYCQAYKARGASNIQITSL